MSVSTADIHAAQARLAGHVLDTPCLGSRTPALVEHRQRELTHSSIAKVELVGVRHEPISAYKR